MTNVNVFPLFLKGASSGGGPSGDIIAVELEVELDSNEIAVELDSNEILVELDPDGLTICFED